MVTEAKLDLLQQMRSMMKSRICTRVEFAQEWNLHKKWNLHKMQNLHKKWNQHKKVGSAQKVESAQESGIFMLLHEITKKFVLEGEICTKRRIYTRKQNLHKKWNLHKKVEFAQVMK